MSGDMIPGPADNQDVVYKTLYFFIVAVLVAGVTGTLKLMENGQTYQARVLAIFSGLIVFSIAGYVAKMGLEKTGIKQ